jgi:alkanesulfonate monooxygenase SsuD/methylene tetrahydromethanopterin reductase-like flavin-dependent oxidoreductase (luciferase family)
VLEVEGRAELQPQLNRLSKRADVAAMVDLIDDDLLTTLAVRGTPEECAAEILRRFSDVAQRVCVYFPGYDAPDADIRALAAALHAG